MCFGSSGDGQCGEIIKGHKKTFESDGYVHYLDCGDGFTGVNTCKLIKFPL